jgi:RimJ/RimL family protein N-acetyltransferase
MKYLRLADPVADDIHAVCHDLDGEERRQVEALTGMPYDPDRLAYTLARAVMEPSWAVRDERERTLILAGGWEISPGVWDVYCLTRPATWTEFGEEATDILNGLIQSMFHDYGARRLEVRCLAGRAKARRWYERHLGLEYEGTLRGVGVNGEDVAMYAKLRAA